MGQLTLTAFTRTTGRDVILSTNSVFASQNGIKRRNYSWLRLRRISRTRTIAESTYPSIGNPHNVLNAVRYTR